MRSWVWCFLCVPLKLTLRQLSSSDQFGHWLCVGRYFYMCSRLPAADDEGQCKTFKWATPTVAPPHQWLCNPLGCEHAQSQSSTTLPASTTLPVVQSCKLPRPAVHCLPVLYCLPACVCVSYRLQIVGTSLYSSSEHHQDLKQQSKHIVTGGLGSVIAVRKLWLLTRSLESHGLSASTQLLVLLDRCLSR